jgi:hypothetical protein
VWAGSGISVQLIWSHYLLGQTKTKNCDVQLFMQSAVGEGITIPQLKYQVQVM